MMVTVIIHVVRFAAADNDDIDDNDGAEIAGYK